MKILSISARNYRVHQDVAIGLDPSRTVIGGPNESGKSTLMEAAHRALFMRYKTGGDVQSEMISDGGGQPNVTVDFEVDGKRYQIAKRFSGQTGTAVLTQEGAATLKNEEAESRLAELLGVDVAAGKTSRTQWAHLWVWQGYAFNDPTESANSQVGSLLEQFQRSGAAVARQSLLDGKVAAKFEAMLADYYTKPGSIKKHSALAVAIDRHDRAVAAVAQAEAARDKLYAAASELEGAEQAIKDLKGSLADAEQDGKALAQRREQLTGLRTTEQLQQLHHAAAVEALQQRQSAESKIGQLRRTAAELRDSLAPLLARAADLTQLAVSARVRADAAATELEEAANRLRTLRHHATLAGLFERRLRLHADRALLDVQAGEVAQLQQERQAVLARMATLPAVSTEQLEQLTAAQQSHVMAEASLSAMAAGVELLASPSEVRLDSTVLHVGERHVLTADAIISVGEALQLRITPGGGASLGETQRQRDAALRAFQLELDALGVGSVAQARAARDQLVELQDGRASIDLRLAERGASTIAETREELERTLSGVDADIERRTALGGDHPATTTLPQAVEQHRLLAEELERSEAIEARLLEVRHTAADDLVTAISQSDTHQQSLKAQQEELAESETALGGLLSVHGDDDARAQSLAICTGAVATCEDALIATRSQIAELQPELLDLDEQRNIRTRKSLLENRTANEQTIALSRHMLAQDGSRDPHAELAAALDVEIDARGARERVELHARAIELLNRHFKAEQEDVASEFAAPLREKVTGYLRCLYGPHTTVQLDYDGDALSGLGLERRGEIQGAYAFEALSGGAREQLAAALRLGVAEVLAAGHGNSLPVVFDDAFAYSDPHRLEGLQRMLDLAAERGLQVIVLTCNPRDYSRFGAKEVLLKAMPALQRVERPAEFSEPVSSATDSLRASMEADIGAMVDHDVSERDFLLCLQSLDGKSGAQSLREQLGWDELRFDRVKNSLREAGSITIGRGRGGSIMLAHHLGEE